MQMSMVAKIQFRVKGVISKVELMWPESLV